MSSPEDPLETPPLPPAPPPAPESVRAADPTRGQGGSGARRVRWAMYAVLLTMAVAIWGQAWVAMRMQAMHDLHAECLELASQQRPGVQEMVLLAAALAGRPRDDGRLARDLERQLDQAQQRAQALDRKLGAGGTMAGDDATVAALAGWQSANEALWQRVREVSAASAARPAGRSSPQADAALEQALQALQSSSAQVEDRAQALLSALRQASDARTQALQQQLVAGSIGLTLLLVALALGVVEPTVRFLRQRARRLADATEQAAQLALVARHTSSLVLITDARDRVVWVNEAFRAVGGVTLEEVQGLVPSAFTSADGQDPRLIRRVRRAMIRRQGLRHEWLHRSADGREHWFDVDLRPLHDREGRFNGFVRVATDVSGRVRQEAQLKALWAALPVGVLMQSDRGVLVDANRAAERILGMSAAQIRQRSLAGADWGTLREDGQPYPLQELPGMRTLATGQGTRNEAVGLPMPDGSVRWLLVNTEPHVDAKGRVRGVVWCFSDVTEFRVLQDQLSTSARTDSLTRLPNRAVVMDRLEQALAHVRRHPADGFALLFMDFDRFKQVNDTLGHGAGDELLRQIAQRLNQVLRCNDTVMPLGSAPLPVSSAVAARLGGDEFVVLLDGVCAREAVAAVAERLLVSLAEPYRLANSAVHSSVSIGVVLVQGEQLASELDAQAVLRDADTAMYEAKRHGRGRWVMFDPSMHDRVVRTLALEQDLRLALQRDELFVVYQPVVDLGSRRVIGVEALARWRHPRRGLVPPLEFIPVAEESGLIEAVGQSVLRMACRQFVGWQQQLGSAAPRQLAVNLSRAQLQRPGLVAQVRDLIGEVGLPPQALQLEVTESLAAQDERVQATLLELKELGVKLALDDFGTGYSSLACLHQMPVDTVKVDRSFTRHAETVEYHRVLIEATIRVARTLGMTTVAEGIETEGQARLMQELDCDRGQGWLFSQPLEAQELATLLQRQEREQEQAESTA